ncbi:MAG TPA: hypothetical protein ENO01_00915 [Candidatus Marinimicrobia bacterium]|nr:hypothetical protein [Candidatus Neomarinimicrobiota bacterium]
MIKWLIISLLSFLPVSLTGAAPLQWSEIENPLGKPLFFSSDFFPGYHHPENEFYTWENNGTLWQVKDKRWEKIISADFTPQWIHYAMTIDSAIVRSVVMTDYRSLVTIYRNGRPVYEDTLSTVPLRYLSQITENIFIIAGDWGSFYVLENDIPRRMNVPFSRHIVSARRTVNGNLWLAVRDDGLYYYDNQSWRFIPLPEDDRVDVKAIFTCKDSLTGFISNKGKVYSHNQQGFSRIKTLFASEFYWYGQQKDKRKIVWGAKGHFYDIYDDNWKKIPLAGDITVNSVLMLSQNNVIVSLSNGKLLQGQNINKLIFRELSGYYHLDGGRYESESRGMIHDFTGNGYKDILLLHSNENNNLSFYTQTDSMVFSNMTYTAGLNPWTDITHMTTGDISGNGQADLLLLTRPEGIYSVITLINQSGTFKELHTFSLDDTLLQQIDNILLYDLDDDGVLDLMLAGRYGIGSRKGSVVWYKGRRNRKWTERTVIDSTRFWNAAVNIADFDNDGRDDLFISNYWHEDLIIFDFPVNRKTVMLPGYFNSFQVVVSDIFPDGYPDILRHNSRELSILKNNGNQTFTEIKPETILKSFVPPGLLNSISTTDINNDGLPDILLSFYPDPNQLWLNNGDGTFTEAAEDIQIAYPPVQFFLTDDMDNDGDMDIYGLRPGHNSFWQNQQKSPDPLEIHWHGSGADYAMPPLVMTFHTSANDTFTVWTNPSHSYPVKSFILPPNLFRLKVGTEESQTLTVSDGNILNYSEKPLWIISLKKLWFQIVYHLHQSRIWLITGTFFLMLLILNLFQNLGIRTFQWNLRIRQVLIITNITLFWVMMAVISHQRILIQYGLPLLIILVLNSLPFIVAIPALSRFKSQNMPEKREALLRQLMIFSHGEWAMNGLNGLILLMKNFPGNGPADPSLLEALKAKMTSFLELTFPKIEELVRMGKQTDISPDLFNKLENISINIARQLRIFSSSPANMGHLSSVETAQLITIAKTLISDIRHETYAFFKCNALDVIHHLMSEYNAHEKYQTIRFHLINENDEEFNVLIRPDELADILDNLIQNAAKALVNCDRKFIQISLQKVAHQGRIIVADSGINISPEQRSRIFDMAYSGWGSSGKGLAFSSAIAKKYGGRLYLGDDSPLDGATFILELNLN